jgi:hypothetical protein
LRWQRRLAMAKVSPILAVVETQRPQAKTEGLIVMRRKATRDRAGNVLHCHPATLLGKINADLDAVGGGRLSRRTVQDIIDTLTYADEKNLFPRRPHSASMRAKISAATREAMAARGRPASAEAGL